MQITLELFQLFDLLAFTTAIILGFIFLFKSPKANIYLGLFLLSLSLEIMHVFGAVLSEVNSFNINVSIQTSLLTLVFVLFYVKQHVSGFLPKKYWLLTLPTFLFNIISILISMEEETWLLRPLEYLFNISIIVYTFKLLIKHENNVINYYSDIEQKTLWWIKSILYVFLAFHLLWIIEDIVSFFNQNLPEVFANISTLATFVLVYWIGYKGLAQPEIFNQSLYKEDVVIEPIAIIEEKALEETMEINEDDLALFKKIKSAIESQKLYTNSELNLRSLAIDLNLKEKELSRLINTQTNFYQLINSLRVEEFKHLLQSTKAEQLSLLGLAHEAGFSSKSTFYTAFKKLEGMTPKQYENNLKKSE